MKVLIIGAGTVGTALGSLITTAGHTVTYVDLNTDWPTRKDYDIIEYTVPQRNEDDPYVWGLTATTYVRDSFTCRYFIIHSSIIPTIFDEIKKNPFWETTRAPVLIYSPIRATEAIMPQQLKTEKKFWAFVNEPVLYKQHEVMEYLHSVYPQGTRRFHDAQALAFGKLLEVVDFGLQILFAQQVKLACEEHGWHFEEAYTEYRKESKYGADYTKLKKGAPMKWVPRAIFRPDVIGGKCVIQDAELLRNAEILTELMDNLIGGNGCFGMKRLIDEHKDEIQTKLWGTKNTKTS